MTARLVVMLVLVACASNPPPRPRQAERVTIARADVPAEIQKLLPTHGVFLAGGGDKSPVFRIVIDTDAKTIYTGKAPAATPLHGALAEERTRELTPPNEQHLMQLCMDAQSEPAPEVPPERVLGYDEILVIVDGDNVFFLQGRGPITRPRAIKAIEALRAAAAL
jgi:hypothetical protein